MVRVKNTSKENGQIRTIFNDGENAELGSHYRKCYGGLSAKEKWNFHVIQQYHFWIWPNKIRAETSTNIGINVIIASH